MNDLDDNEVAELTVLAMKQAEESYFAGDYERVIEICYAFTSNNVILATPYMYSSLTFMTMAESGNFGDKTYEIISNSYQIAHRGIIASKMDSSDSDYSMLHFLKGKALHSVAIIELDPEEQVFKKRIHNELIILDALDCFEKSTNLPDFLNDSKALMVQNLKSKLSNIDNILKILVDANRNIGAMIDAMELMTTFQEFAGDSEKLVTIVKKQQDILKAIDKISNISKFQRNRLENYCSGLMALCIGQALEARDKYFALLNGWNPGGVVTTGVKMANVCIDTFGGSVSGSDFNNSATNNSVTNNHRGNPYEEFGKMKTMGAAVSPQNTLSSSLIKPINKLDNSIDTLKGSQKNSNPYEEFGKMKTIGATDATPISCDNNTKPSAISAQQIKKSENTSSNATQQNYSSSSSGSIRLFVFGAVLILLTVGLYFSINAEPESPKQSTAFATKESNLRSFPAKGNNIISTIPKGSSITVIENNGEWMKVRFNNTEGYLKSSLVSKAP